MTNGQQVAVTALEQEALNIIEHPWGSNSDNGEWIDDSQARWGLRGEPWCGCGVDYIFSLAGVNDHGLGHPATWVIAQRADALGGCRPKGDLHPGSIVLRAPFHVEVLIRRRPSGLLECVGGNVNQGLRETVRDPGEYRIVEPPGLRDMHPDSNRETISIYWFEDPRLDPQRYGGWSTKAAREKWIKTHIPPAKLDMVRRIRVNKPAPYAIDVYSGERWKWGPWRSKDARNLAQLQVERDYGRKMRSRSKDIPANGVGLIELRRSRKIVGVTSGETTT